MQPEQSDNFYQPAADPAQPVVTEAPAPRVEPEEAITWQASEFVHYEKSAVWFLALLGFTGVLLVLDWFLIKSWTFGVLVVVMAVAIIVIGRRPPHMVNYSLSDHGITIDQKYFNLHDFKFFGIVQEGAMHSVRLVSHKRFMPMVSVFLPPDQAEMIVDVLGSALPMQQLELSVIDRFAERIRF